MKDKLTFFRDKIEKLLLNFPGTSIFSKKDGLRNDPVIANEVENLHPSYLRKDPVLSNAQSKLLKICIDIKADIEFYISKKFYLNPGIHFNKRLVDYAFRSALDKAVVHSSEIELKDFLNNNRKLRGFLLTQGCLLIANKVVRIILKKYLPSSFNIGPNLGDFQSLINFLVKETIITEDDCSQIIHNIMKRPSVSDAEKDILSKMFNLSTNTDFSTDSQTFSTNNFDKYSISKNLSHRMVFCQLAVGLSKVILKEEDLTLNGL